VCYGAIHWAKIPKCVYAATQSDAAAVGFDDKFIYVRRTPASSAAPSRALPAAHQMSDPCVHCPPQDAIRGISDVEHVKFTHEPHQGASDVFKGEYSMY
jgi:hypothetical protein